MKIIPIAIVIVFLYSCGGSSTSNKDEHDHGHGGGAEGSSVVLSPAQMTSLSLTLDSIKSKSIADVLKLTGIITVPPQFKADVSSPTEGLVQTINVNEGQRVSKGQVLVTVSNSSFIRLQQDYLESKSKLVFLEAEYARQNKLAQENVNAKKAFQEAEADYRSGQARLASIEKQLQLLGINTSGLSQNNIESVIAIKAPISGVVSHISVNIGASVSFASTLLKIIDNSESVLEIVVFEQDLGNIKIGQIATFTLTSATGESYRAQVNNIGSTFENESKAIKVRAKILDSFDGLIDGMNANVFLALTDKVAPCVPSEAVVNYQGGDYIFIYSESMQHDLLHSGHEHEEEHKHTEDHQHEDSHEEVQKEPEAGSLAFLKIAVKKGSVAGGYSEITPLQEIPKDARVVTKGAFYVLAAITNQGEAHSH